MVSRDPKGGKVRQELPGRMVLMVSRDSKDLQEHRGLGDSKEPKDSKDPQLLWSI